MEGQGAWRFCDECFGMLFNGDPADFEGKPPRKGVCPAGGPHHAQGFGFYLLHHVTEAVGQKGWRFCDECFGIFYNDDPRGIRGICPAGGGGHRGPHEVSWPFFLPYDRPVTEGQPGWRCCDKCYGMFYNDDPRGIKGICPADGGPHSDKHSWPFVLPHRDFPKPTLLASAGAVPGEGKVIEVTGSGFEPNQRAEIHYQVQRYNPKGIGGNVDEFESATIDSEGVLYHLVRIGSDLVADKNSVSAFDFGSGETAVAPRF